MPAELTGAHRERLSPPGRCAPLTTRQRGEDPSFMSSMLWIGTRKGLFALRADGARRSWKLAGPQFLGHIIHHVVQDPRELRTLLMAAKTGHLGPTVFRSGDRGRSWREAAQPPAFRKALEGEEARAVQRVFWLTPGHRNETGTWYAGSSPAGLFRSSDGGERWEPVAGFNDNPMRPKWAAFPTPDGEFLHSILVDPRDARHLYIAISIRSEEHTSELQSQSNLVCRLLLEKKKHTLHIHLS